MQYDTSEMKTFTVDLGSDVAYEGNHYLRAFKDGAYTVNVSNSTAELSRVKKIAVVSCSVPNMLPNLRVGGCTITLEEYDWGLNELDSSAATTVEPLYFTSSEPGRHVDVTQSAWSGKTLNLVHGADPVIPQDIYVTMTQLLDALNDTDAFRKRALTVSYDATSERFFWKFTNSVKATEYMNNIVNGAPTKELRLVVRYAGNDIQRLRRLNFFKVLGYENVAYVAGKDRNTYGWQQDSAGAYVQSLLLNDNSQLGSNPGANNQDIIDSGHALYINQWHRLKLLPPNFIADPYIHVAIDRCFTGKRVVPGNANTVQYEVAATVPLANVPHGGFVFFEAPDQHLYDIDFLDRSGHGQSLNQSIRVRLLSSMYTPITDWPTNYPVSLVLKVFADRQDRA